MKTKMEKIIRFCKKPLISKAAITLSSFAVGVALYSFAPSWPEEKQMPDALKKRLR